MKDSERSNPGKSEAIACLHRGQLVEARQILKEACLRTPNDAEAFYLLGDCLGMLGNYQEAAEALQSSLELQPKVMPARFALGGALKMLGKSEDAIEHFHVMLESAPDNTDAHIALADTLATMGNFSEAQQHFRKALKLAPESAAPHMGLGVMDEQIENHTGALAHFRNAIKCAPHSPRTLCAAGRALSNLGQWQEARSLYRKALKYSPQYPDALGGLARIHDRNGEYEKVARQVEPLLRDRAYSTSAAMAFINVCEHLGRCEEAVDYAEELLRHLNDLPPRSRSNLHMAIARALDRMGLYKEAFEHFKAGNETTRLNYDPVGHRIGIDALIETFSRAALFRLPRAQINTSRPIFIVGMPRSGTSLTEQILASHPQVAGAGELTELNDIMQTLPRELGSKQKWPQCIADLEQDSVERQTRRYLDKLRSVSKKARRVTDKMPQNYYLLGLIELMFPKARIIHCRRDPFDTCLSIYFQSFLDSHSYARDLFNLGTHYHQYRRLMNHWKQSLTIPILDVQYENLISKPDTVIQAMLEFCELEWDERCLSFHKLDRKVDTASYDQVRQPLYTASVQRWQHYEQYLDTLKDGLERGY